MTALTLGFALTVTTCYDPNFIPSTTSVFFNMRSVFLERKIENNWTGSVDLVLSLRPSINFNDVDIVFEVPESSFEGKVEFVHPPAAFDPDGTARVKVMVGPTVVLDEKVSFSVQAWVTEKSTGRVFLDWCQITVQSDNERY